MEPEDLLEKENVEKVLSPHPLSFMGLQSLCIFLLVWGVLFWWIMTFSEFRGFFSEWYIAVATWGIILLLAGVIASLLSIKWSIFFLYAGIFAGGLGLIFWQGWYAKDTFSVFILFYSSFTAIIGFLFVEWYRRSHRYIISNLRLVFQGGIVTKRERTLRYDKITDIDSRQGILGQIFGFGSIIPISQSGFGLGSDQSFAAGGVEVGTKKVGLLGLFGGGKEVQTPRARTYYELHGVHPYKEIKKLMENLVQSNVLTQYQQEQVEVQKQQVDVQKEQMDLQKQMRDMLKKQADISDENEK